MATRQTVIRFIAMGCLVGGLWLAHTQQRPPASLRIDRVRGDIYLISPLGGPDGRRYSRVGTVAAYVTDEGVILVDDRFSEHVPQILEQLRTVTDQPVRYVINTHFHMDHSGGNSVLVKQSEIIAHANARAKMKAMNAWYEENGRSERHALPRVTFQEKAAINLGGKEVRLHYFGRGHTDGDVVVYFPAEKVVHVGDLFAASLGFLIDARARGSGREWGATLGKVLGLEFDTVIRGHTEVTTREELVQHRKKFLVLNAKVEELIAGGVPRDQILDRISLDDIPGWDIENGLIRTNVLLLYDELIAGG